MVSSRDKLLKIEVDYNKKINKKKGPKPLHTYSVKTFFVCFYECHSRVFYGENCEY